MMGLVIWEGMRMYLQTYRYTPNSLFVMQEPPITILLTGEFKVHEDMGTITVNVVNIEFTHISSLGSGDAPSVTPPSGPTYAMHALSL